MSTFEDLINGVIGEGANVITGLVDTFTLQGFREPDNIQEAIYLHQERVKELTDMRQRGFTSIDEYRKYKEAQDLVAKYN